MSNELAANSNEYDDKVCIIHMYVHVRVVCMHVHSTVCKMIYIYSVCIHCVDLQPAGLLYAIHHISSTIDGRTAGTHHYEVN